MDSTHPATPTSPSHSNNPHNEKPDTPKDSTNTSICVTASKPIFEQNPTNTKSLALSDPSHSTVNAKDFSAAPSLPNPSYAPNTRSKQPKYHRNSTEYPSSSSSTRSSNSDATIRTSSPISSNSPFASTSTTSSTLNSSTSPNPSSKKSNSSKQITPKQQLKKWYRKLTVDERRRILSIVDEELGELVLLMSLKLQKEGHGLFFDVGANTKPNVSPARNRSNSLSNLPGMSNSRPLLSQSRQSRSENRSSHHGSKSDSRRSKSQSREPILRFRSSSINSSTLDFPTLFSSDNNKKMSLRSFSSLPSSLSGSSDSAIHNPSSASRSKSKSKRASMSSEIHPTKNITSSKSNITNHFPIPGLGKKQPAHVRYFDDFFASDLIALNPYTSNQEDFLFYREKPLFDFASSSTLKADQVLIDAVRLGDTKQYLDTLTLDSDMLKDPKFFFDTMRKACRGEFLSEPCLICDTDTRTWLVSSPSWLNTYYTFGTYLASKFERALWQGFFDASPINQKQKSKSNSAKSAQSVARQQELISKSHLVEFWKELSYIKRTDIIMSMGNLIEAKMAKNRDISALTYTQLLNFMAKLSFVSHNVSKADNPLLQPNHEREFIDFIFLSPLRRAGTSLDLVLRRLGVFIETAYANKQSTDLLLGEKMEKERAQRKKKSKQHLQLTAIPSSSKPPKTTVSQSSQPSPPPNATFDDQLPAHRKEVNIGCEISSVDLESSRKPTITPNNMIQLTAGGAVVAPSTTVTPASATTGFTIVAGRRKGHTRAKDDSDSQKTQTSQKSNSDPRRSKDDTHTPTEQSWPSKKAGFTPKLAPLVEKVSMPSSSIGSSVSDSSKSSNKNTVPSIQPHSSASTHAHTSVVPAINFTQSSAPATIEDDQKVSPTSNSSISSLTTISTSTTHESSVAQYDHNAAPFTKLQSSSESLPIPTSLSFRMHDIPVPLNDIDVHQKLSDAKKKSAPSSSASDPGSPTRSGDEPTLINFVEQSKKQSNRPLRSSMPESSPPRSPEKPKSKNSPHNKSEPRIIPPYSNKSQINDNNNTHHYHRNRHYNNNHTSGNQHANYVNTRSKTMSVSAQPYYPYSIVSSPPSTSNFISTSLPRRSTPPGRLVPDEWGLANEWYAIPSPPHQPLEFGSNSNVPTAPQQYRIDDTTSHTIVGNGNRSHHRGKRGLELPEFHPHPMPYLMLPIALPPLLIPTMQASPYSMTPQTSPPCLPFRVEFPARPTTSCERLTQDMQDFVAKTDRVSQDKAPHVADVSGRIQLIVDELWPNQGLTAEIYGSFATTLDIPSSDLDISIKGMFQNSNSARLNPNVPTPSTVTVGVPSSPNPFVSRLSTSLPTSPREAPASPVVLLGRLLAGLSNQDWIDHSRTRFYDQASVPVIKLVTIRGLNIDITMEDAMKPHTGGTSKVMAYGYIAEYPELRPLAKILKQMLHDCHLHEAYSGGISSYYLILLIFSFLQQYCKSIYSKLSSREARLGQLLLDFLEFYGHKFSFSKVQISTIGEGSHLWVQNPVVVKTLEGTTGPPSLMVVDPLNPSQVIGQSIFGMWDVVQAFQNAYSILMTQYCGAEVPNQPAKIEELLQNSLRKPIA